MTSTRTLAVERRGAPWVFVILAGLVLLIVSTGGLEVLVTVVAGLAEVLFITYFIRHLSFAIAALRSAPADLNAPLLDSGYRPPVTVIVACRNEEAVVDDLVSCLLSLQYATDLLQLIVVDDASDDRTGELLDRWAAAHPRLRVIHRPLGAGGAKPGALNAGLDVATGEVVVVFDADHRPRPDVVYRLVRHFEDPSVSAAQGRCVIRNPGDSPLTRLVAIDYLAGYLVNEYGRQYLFELPAYGGANCAVRTSALRSLGGWSEGSVAEDTDLTIRLKLAGGRVRYDLTALDEEEGVVTLRAYWRQRYRWARGHQQVWRDFRKAVWRSRLLSPAEKIESTLFLGAFHLPVVSAAAMAVLVLWGAGVVTPINPFNTFVLWTLLFLGSLLELGAGLVISRADRKEAVALVWFLPMFFVSLVLCTKAWIDGVAGRRYGWAKTARSAGPAGVGA